MKSRSQESCAPADPARLHARRRRTTRDPNAREKQALDEGCICILSAEGTVQG